MLSRMRTWRLVRLTRRQWSVWCQRKRAPVDELTRLTQETKAAWREYQAAHVYFNYAEEPELIDHSIYRLEAAKRRFIYLWNRLRALRKERDCSHMQAPVLSE